MTCQESPINLDVEILPVWNLTQGVGFCQTLETVVKKLGWHVALGGSVLYKGESHNDLDVFLYQHNTGNESAAFTVVLAELVRLGFIGNYEHRNHEKYGDKKRVYQAFSAGKKLNLFFL